MGVVYMQALNYTSYGCGLHANSQLYSYCVVNMQALTAPHKGVVYMLGLGKERQEPTLILRSAC